MISEYPLVSVIIPLFNAEQYIKQALDSIMVQTYKNVEIIVVDDCSTDNSLDIVSNYEKVKIIKSEQHRYPSYARNLGLRESQGELIAFLDADDFWVVEEKLELQVGILLKKKDVDGVYGKFKNFFETNKTIPPFIKDKYLDEKFGTIINLGTLVIKKSSFDKIGFFSEEIHYGEDLDWFIRAKDAGLKLIFYPMVFMHRRLHNKNLSYEAHSDKKNLLQIFHQSIERKRKGKK